MTKTLSHLHQLNASYIHYNTFLRQNLVFHNKTTLNLSLYSELLQKQLRFFDISAKNTFVVSQIEYLGTTYKKDMYVVYNENAQKCFGCILMLLVKDARTIFMVVEQILHQEVFQMGVFRFLTGANESFAKVLQWSDLLDYMPLVSYTLDGLCLLSLKHAMVELP